MSEREPGEARRLMDLFLIGSIEEVSKKETNIVPVNISFFPVRAKENILSKLALTMTNDIPPRVVEEIMTEGTMLLSGVDIDIRFGRPLNVKKQLDNKTIKNDINETAAFGFDDLIPSRKTMRKTSRKLMLDYMSDIYSMTTINHDHIFASLLKNTWYRSFDHNFLKRRTFLVASELLTKHGLYLHKDLTNDQTHLLTDDCRGNCEDFIQTALKTDVLKEINNSPLGPTANHGCLERIDGFSFQVNNKSPCFEKIENLPSDSPT